MSAPDVNIEKQKRRHLSMVRGIWIGAAVAAVVVIAAAIAVIGFGVQGDAIIPSETEAAAS